MAPAPAPGTLLAGRFLVERLAGEGGMGQVWVARHTELSGRVALKMLHSGPVRAEAVERLRREARAGAALRGEHAAHVKDFLLLDDGTPLLVMEFVPGHPASRELADRGPLPPGEVASLGLDVCLGLAEAHALGIVHRDIKPSNLMLSRRPDGSELVKILDFGVARVAPGASGLLTEAEALLGSPVYMSPEQARNSHDVDARSDLWSLGVTLYQLLSGRLPFRGYSTADILAAVLTDDPVPLDAERPELPAALVAAVMRCLEKDLGRRCASAAALAAALEPFASPPRPGAAEQVRRILEGRAELFLTQPAAPSPARTPAPGDETRAPGASSLAISPSTGSIAPPLASPAPRSRAGLAPLLGSSSLLLGLAGFWFGRSSRQTAELQAHASAAPAASSPQPLATPPAPSAAPTPALSAAASASAAPQASVIAAPASQAAGKPRGATKARPALAAPAADTTDFGGRLRSAWRAPGRWRRGHRGCRCR